ncbi:RNase H family protein [Rhodococcus spongiicola]|uniref:RNase H family protein n=1 Tax=Rhodococcus spongiicola TaxID=2487352 RepID=UPI000FDE1FF9|nr:RNase H family protein [Rhodococcus spongiicola]
MKEAPLLAVIHIRRYSSTQDDLVRAVAAWQVNGAVSTRQFEYADATDASYYRAGLDAFALLLDMSTVTSEPILLHITDNKLRNEIDAVVESFPSVTIVDVARGAVLDLTHAALDTLVSHHRYLVAADEELERAAAEEERARVAAEEERERERITALPVLTVATDASKSRRRGVGVACVSEDGVRHQKMVPNVTTVLEGELLAIELAIDRFAERRLHILTDSQRALQHLGVLQTKRWPLRLTVGEKAAVARIQEAMQGRKIRLSWVRGHDGHLLNETAHRLAMAVRRAHEARIPAETRRAIAEQIVEPLRVAA